MSKVVNAYFDAIYHFDDYLEEFDTSKVKLVA